MTLEESGRKALYAAGMGDLDGLRCALEARSQAIQALRDAPACEDVRARLLAAHQIGEAIAQHIRRFKVRTGLEIAHLAGSQGPISADSAPAGAHLDVRG